MSGNGSEPRNERRAATTDVSAFAIGARRLQLIVMPSFEPAQAWEVRQLDTKWSLFRCKVVIQAPEIVLLGYDPISAVDAMLASYFQRLTALSLPLLQTWIRWGAPTGRSRRSPYSARSLRKGAFNGGRSHHRTGNP